MLASDIPSDVWLAISSLVINPKTHITLSRICRSSRANYESEERWKHLCREIGLGRSLIDKRTWKNVYLRTVRHRGLCRFPRCFQFGLPPTTATGDLLSTPEEVLQHVRYFKDLYPCTCGQSHSDDGHEDDEGEDEESDDEDHGSISSSIDDEVPQIDDFLSTLMADTMRAMVGLPPLPPPRRSKPKTSQVQTPAHLLPLSRKNHDRVPFKPTLHPLLADFGSAQFAHLLSGRLALQPPSSPEPPKPAYVAEGIDWDNEVQPNGVRRDSLFVAASYHGLLTSAFAINIEPRPLFISITNPTGVTVGDFTSEMSAYMKAPLSAAELRQTCPDYPHPECELNRYRTRFGFAARDYPQPKQVRGKPLQVRECYMSGSTRVDTLGDVHCDMILHG